MSTHTGQVPTGNGATVPPPPDPPRLDELVLRTHAFLTSTLAQSVKEPVGMVGRWMGRKVLLFSIALACMVGATGFMLCGMVMLLTMWLPTFAACLTVGGASLILGLVVLQSARP